MIHTRCEVGYGHAVKWSDKILQERKKRVHHNLPKTDTALTNDKTKVIAYLNEG